MWWLWLRYYNYLHAQSVYWVFISLDIHVAWLVLPLNKFAFVLIAVCLLIFLGKAAILELEVVSYGQSSDEPICMNRQVPKQMTWVYMTCMHYNYQIFFLCRLTLYLRGAGGFSKLPQRYSYTNYQANRNVAFKHPKSRPFAVYEECTQPSQVCHIFTVVASSLILECFISL